MRGTEEKIKKKKRQKSRRKRGFEIGFGWRICYKFVFVDEKDEDNAVQQWRETTKRIIFITGQRKH